MTITRSQLRTSTRTEMKIDRLGKIWGDTEMDEAINDAISQVAVDNDYKWQELKSTGTDTSVADQQEYDLPSDFVILDLVRYNGITLGSVTYKELKETYPTFPKGSTIAYYERNYKVGLHFIPTETGTAFDYEYRASAPLLELDTNTMIYKDNMKRLVVLQTAFILFGKYTDQQMIARANAKKTLYSDELGKAKKRNALGDNNQIDTYKTSYNPRGRNRRTGRVTVI